MLEIQENEADYGASDLENYKKKVNHYIRRHEDNPVIAKLKTNRPLLKTDIAELEKILWSEVGSKKDYQKEYGDTPLGELVRSIVGLDIKSAKEAFSKFLDDANINQQQSYFINQIINYIAKNGMLKDFSVLQSSPFSDKGSVSELFTNATVMDIRQTIETINKNADVA